MATLPSTLLVLANPEKPQPDVSEKALSALVAFKATAEKNDPERAQDRHGPYEQLTLQRTGNLPDDYYEAGDDEPWGLLVTESRSNILWQVVSGMMDRQPDFAAAYMALTLDTSLGDEDYTKELKNLNKEWAEFQMKSHFHLGDQHTSMSHIYGSVVCPACSVLTSLAIRDEGMRNVFEAMRLMEPQDRKPFLREQGLLGLLDRMIPDPEVPSDEGKLIFE